MKVAIKKVAFISLGVNVFLILLFLGKRYSSAHFFNPVPKTPEETLRNWGDIWNKHRTAVFEILPIHSKDIVFVGTSLTEGFPLAELFPGLPVKNRGIGWNESRHILGRIGSIAKCHPSKIFVEMGVNDLRNKVPVDTVFENLKRTVSIIKNVSPQTTIIVESLTPNGMKNVDNQPSIIEMNQRLQPYCEQEKIAYVDLYSPLYKNGELDSSYTCDGIHLNGDGYEIWKDRVMPFVREAMEEEPQ